MRTVAVLAALIVALAGCNGGGKDGDKKADDGSPSKGVPMLQGYIVDLAIRPLPGATVKVLDGNASAVAADDGHYGLDDLPTDKFIVIVVAKAGFITASKQITLAPDTPVILNFTLEAQPIKAASSTQDTFHGNLGCQIATLTPTGNNSLNCGTALSGAGQSLDRYDFPVGADLAGAVIELFWDPTTPLADTLMLTVETLELGQLNVVLGEQVGTGPLRIQVPQADAERYYPQGGLMRLSVKAASDGEENEAGVGYSIAVNQQFDAFISLFYVEPPPPGYTIGNQ